MNAKNIIDKLHLKPHPEGGYYSETYRSAESLINNEGNKRSVCTAIYYMLENDDKSNFHRIKSEELWFFHQGEPLEILVLENGGIKTILLGNNILNGEIPQAIVPANTWFAARIKNGKGYSLVSCTVAPGFDFADFELAKKEDLIKEYPNLQEVIEEFTR
jgi:predicted cupin superfamily sugar epimerase